jgi:uncharacterized protein (TIGR00369 family)
VSALGIEITAVGEDSLSGTMPVDQRTKQPWGLLHGGASVALAETAASLAGWMNVDGSKENVVGIEINANHLRGSAMGGSPASRGRSISGAPRTSGNRDRTDDEHWWYRAAHGHGHSGAGLVIRQRREFVVRRVRLVRCRSHCSLESADERSASSQASWTRRAGCRTASCSSGWCNGSVGRAGRSRARSAGFTGWTTRTGRT